jgi:hypothetical protein
MQRAESVNLGSDWCFKAHGKVLLANNLEGTREWRSPESPVAADRAIRPALTV